MTRRQCIYTMPPWFRPGFWTNKNHGKHGCTDVDGPMILIVGWVTRYLTSIQLRTGEDSSILATTEMFGACKTWVELANLDRWLATGNCQKMRMFVCLAEKHWNTADSLKIKKGSLEAKNYLMMLFFPTKKPRVENGMPPKECSKETNISLGYAFPFQHFWPKQVLHLKKTQAFQLSQGKCLCHKVPTNQKVICQRASRFQPSSEYRNRSDRKNLKISIGFKHPTKIPKINLRTCCGDF